MGAVRKDRLWLQQPRTAGQGFPVLNRHAKTKLLQTFRRRNPFYLCPILALVGMTRMKKPFVPIRLVAQEQQAFGIRVESADRIDILRKIEFSQRTVWRTVPGELRQDAEWFVECNKHNHF